MPQVTSYSDSSAHPPYSAAVIDAPALARATKLFAARKGEKSVWFDSFVQRLKRRSRL